MLPATLVTITTFLIELCNSSPVYNMQPAFITNTVGATAGRNIRNLPCISRRNSNQSGFCMFAIDCLKANGTHLGTCIDGFYFGSCCHIEPVRDIIDNTIDTDIIPHREPPYRISSTTIKTVNIPNSSPKNESTELSISSTTSKSTTVTNVTSFHTVTSGIRTPVENGTVNNKLSSTQTTPSTTVPQKLQTFQVVESNIVEEATTKASIMSSTNATIKVDQKPVVTKEPFTVSTTSTSTRAPLISTPSSSTTTKISTTLSTEASLLVNQPNTTVNNKLSSTTGTTTIQASSIKPTKPTKAPSTKATSKPTKLSSKPSKITISTRKPAVVPTKTSSSSSTKTTKKPNTSSKPTKRITTLSSKTTTSRTRITTPKSTVKVTTTTEKVSTRPPVKVTIGQNATSRPQTVSTVLPEKSSTSVPSSSSQPITPSVATTPNSNNASKINSTQMLETVNGNPATNEIEGIDKPDAQTTIKPGIVTWTVVDNKNLTASVPEIGEFNVTTEDWVPITTPDGWVLLPNVGNNLTQSLTTLAPPVSAPQSDLSESVSTSSPANITTGSSTIPTATQTPLAEGSKLNQTIDVTTSSTPTSSNELPESSETTFEPTASFSPLPSTDNVDKPVNMSDFTDVCGRRMYPEARIVGGEKSSFGKWPWQISLRQWRTSTYLHKCGAALLNENWAITAAHCVDNVPPSDLLLRLGEHDLSTEAEPYLHQERRVQIVASHPQFDPRTFEYDLALLRFYEPVNFQPNILPVCVPKTDENFVGRTAHVTGWGRLYEDGPLPSILQEVSVPVINNTVCESMYRAAGYIEHIPHIFICAGWRRGGFDSCEGDSGGPMVIQRQDKRFLLAGVISWGIGCAEPNQPGVYTRISEFRDWINQILQF